MHHGAEPHFSKSRNNVCVSDGRDSSYRTQGVTRREGDGESDPRPGLYFTEVRLMVGAASHLADGAN